MITDTEIKTKGIQILTEYLVPERKPPFSKTHYEICPTNLLARPRHLRLLLPILNF